MKVQMKVSLETPKGEKVQDITADARDVRNYESEFSTSWLTTDLSFTQLAQLAYVTMKRQGSFRGSYDVFDSQCTDVTDVPEVAAEPVGPTRTGAGEKPSPS